ncbi:kinase [Aldersonia sp. NBC_00410]|uniref:phosphotransferase family protein n=1 Tax=Aldersonia sp. NBC_00410 TaxID=2975954 RepID=UPI002259037E|nr:kinase [Aldersonia sp. NBC_00410]MCX5045286.1 kinase [Aldersonia sp. NBC_00410]
MTAVLAERAAEVLAAAQQLLTKRMGSTVKLADPVELGAGRRTVVLRVRVVENTYSLPRTVILKQINGSAYEVLNRGTDARGASVLASAFVREAVCYQFATSLAPANRPGPELLAHDVESRLLVLSDLGDERQMTSLLRTADENAVTNVLMAQAQALGRMHAATVGREDDFIALARRADMDRHDELAEQAEASVHAVAPLLRQQIGIEVPSDILAMVERCSLLFAGGRLRAFSPSDLCPDNIIVNGEGVRFLDYEWGGFRDATLDIAETLVSFPGCLCDYNLSADRARWMIEAWRAEVVGMWPQLADDNLLRRKILDAQLIWVWLSTFWYLPDNNPRLAEVREHGLSVRRSVALPRRWRSLATFAARVGEEKLAAFADTVADAFDAKWVG